jgi:hypothetical protein
MVVGDSVSCSWYTPRLSGAEHVSLVGDDSPARCIAPQDWWEHVLSTSPNYHQVNVLEGGEELGRIQYFAKRSRLGFKWGRNPDWSIPQTLCIRSRLTPQKRTDIIEQLIAQLPTNVSFYLVFREDAGWSQDTVDVFSRHGFEHSRVPTYQWKPKDGDVLGLMKSKARSQLRSAQKNLEIVEIGSDEFLRYYNKNLVLERMRALRPLPLAKELLQTALGQQAARIIAARRPSQSADYDAAIACTWDDERYYYWMSSNSPSNVSRRKPHKDAVKVLVLDAMLHAKSLGLIFDTDGIGSPGSEHLYRDLLKLTRADIRHVFKRTSKFVATYERYRPLFVRKAVRA